MGAVIHRSATGCKWLTLCHNISSQKYTSSVSVIHQKLWSQLSFARRLLSFPPTAMGVFQSAEDLSQSTGITYQTAQAYSQTVDCWWKQYAWLVEHAVFWLTSAVLGAEDAAMSADVVVPAAARLMRLEADAFKSLTCLRTCHSSWGSIFSVLTQKCGSFMSERHPLNDLSWWSSMDMSHSAGLLSSAQCCFCLKTQYIMVPYYCPSTYLEAVFQNDWKSIELLSLS